MALARLSADGPGAWGSPSRDEASNIYDRRGLDYVQRIQQGGQTVDLHGTLPILKLPVTGASNLGGANGLDVKLRPVLVSGNESILHQAAMAGMGFAMVPSWSAQSDLNENRLEAVLPKVDWPKLQLQAIYADRSYLPAKTRSFLDFVSGPNGITSALRDFSSP